VNCATVAALDELTNHTQMPVRRKTMVWGPTSANQDPVSSLSIMTRIKSSL